MPTSASPRPSVTPKKKRKAETAAFMVVAEAPSDRICSWKRRSSSAEAWSGERPKKTVKFSTAARYPRCVQAVKPRTVMSSVMRRRNGLMALSVMGLLPVLRSSLGNHNLNTGQTQPVTAQTAPPVAVNYRVSGLVH